MYNSESPVKRMIKLLTRGVAGRWLTARAAQRAQRRRASWDEDSDPAAAAAAAAAEGTVEVRVQAVCTLRDVRTPNLCTKLGVPGAGLRVTHCTLVPGAQPVCVLVWEGELP